MVTKNTKTKEASAPATKSQVSAASSTAPEAETTQPEKDAPAETLVKPEGQTAISVLIETGKLPKAKKKHGTKVIRDSFSFPEIDYLKILQIKALCLSDGVHVKKGEVLRAGLNLLMQLNQDELKQAINNVERVKTGRPKTSKK